MSQSLVRSIFVCSLRALPSLLFCASLLGSVTDAMGLAANCPASSPADAKGQIALTLPAVTLRGNYFEAKGHPFIPVGVNWVPAEAAMHWPSEWNPQAIETDFTRMHELGVNTVRLDLVWAWFEPRPDDYNPEAFRQLDTLIDLADCYGIYLHPELLVGGEVGEAYWDVPYRQGRNPQSDPYMLRLETDFAAEIAKHFAGRTAILAWDLTDEPPFWVAANSTTDSMAINWTRLLAGAIRRYDHLHPLVVGTSTQDMVHGPFRSDLLAPEMDFLSVHPYTIFDAKLFPDPMLSLRQTYGSAFATALARGAGKPVMIQELGASTAQYSAEAIARYERTALFSSLGAGANGFLLWCYSDTAPMQYARVPYLRSPHETQFGIVTWDGKPRPAATMLSNFSKTVRKMDLQDVAPQQGEAAILVPQEWSKSYGDQSRFGLKGPEVLPYTSTMEGGTVAEEKLPDTHEKNTRLLGAWLSSYILTRRAGITVDFPREYADWQRYRMLVLPSPLTGAESLLTHLHTDFWNKAQRYVEQGGLLYASLSGDSAIPEMETLFGAHLVDHRPVPSATLKIVAPFGSLQPGMTFSYTPSPDITQWPVALEAGSGQVIAVDQDGQPALITHRLGKGQTLLSAYPLETYLANRPSAFENPEDTHLIYQSLLQAAGLQPVLTTGDPAVEADSLVAKEHGYLVLTNHSGRGKTVRLTTTLPIKSLHRLTDNSEAPVKQQQGEWNIDLSPYDGAILRWQ